MRFGIVRDEGLIADRPLAPELLDAVRKLYPSARSGKWWEAAVEMRSPATNWRLPEILWRIHTDLSFLKAVAEQISELAKGAEALLDRLNRTKA